MFDDTFLDSIPQNGYEAAKMLCAEFRRRNSLTPAHVKTQGAYDSYIEAFGVAQGMVEAYTLPIGVPPLTNNREQNITMIIAFFENLMRIADHEFTKSTLENAKTKFALRVGRSFHYEFSEGDLAKAQKLINEIRVQRAHCSRRITRTVY